MGVETGRYGANRQEIIQRAIRTANTSTPATYFAWLPGLSIHRAQSADAASIVGAVHAADAGYDGALGVHGLDENMDLKAVAYEVWIIKYLHWFTEGLQYPMPRLVDIPARTPAGCL